MIISRLLLLFILISPLFADSPSRDIYGLCRITLNSGEVIEGVTVLGNAGITQRLHGFYIVSAKNTVKIVQFNRLFVAIEPFKSLIEYEGRGHSSRTEVTQVYFLKDITYQNWDYKTGEIKRTIITTRGDTILNTNNSPPGYPLWYLNSSDSLRKAKFNVEIINRFNYELLDSIIVYRKMPREYFLDGSIKSVTPTVISTMNIDRFEFLLNPSIQWLDEISAIKEEYWKTISFSERNNPVWYHDIMANPTNYSTLLKVLENRSLPGYQ